MKVKSSVAAALRSVRHARPTLAQRRRSASSGGRCCCRRRSRSSGADEAIVFYEGLRPIRCSKIRYYEDRALSRAAEVPARDRGAGVCPGAAARDTREVGASCRGDERAVVAPSEPVVQGVREATLADLERIDDLTLEDFAVNFDRVKLPAEGRLSEQDMQAAVDSFLESLRTP